MLPAVRVLRPGLAGICYAASAVRAHGGALAERVAVFIDYQNVYMGAREVFHQGRAPHWSGQIDPRALGSLLVEQSRRDRTLSAVRIYRGMPDAIKDPIGFRASQRQARFWSRHPKVRVITRPLRYPKTWPDGKAEEKGIDVSLAVDFVVMAIQGEYDVGILMSTDTDLRPALEAVLRLRAAHIEVAAWSSPQGNWRRLSIKSRRLWCHWLDRDNYGRVQDRRDYSRP